LIAGLIEVICVIFSNFNSIENWHQILIADGNNTHCIRVLKILKIFTILAKFYLKLNLKYTLFEKLVFLNLLRMKIIPGVASSLKVIITRKPFKK
jgi:hypothetical protein